MSSRAASLDIITLIDSATATTCGWCASTLGQGSPSADFCSPEHSELWHAHQADPIATYVEQGHWAGDAARWIDRDRYYRQVFDEIERVHPRYELASRESAQEAFERWADLVSTVQSCEVCGTRIFQFQDSKGTCAWFHVGPTYVCGKEDVQRVRLVRHTSRQCEDDRMKDQLALFGVARKAET